MMLIFGMNPVKFFLFVFNFIFAIFGVAVLALGVVYKLQIEPIVEYLGRDFPVAPDLFIAIGTVAFIVSFFGCVGASRENRPMLMAFVIMLVILLVIELAVVIIAFVEISDGKVEEEINATLQYEKEMGNLGKLESQLECCGITGPFETYNTTIPDYCFDENENFSSTECLDTITDIIENSLIPHTCFEDMDKTFKNLYLTGCFDKIKDVFHKVGLQIGCIALAISILEILGSLFALTLSHLSRKN